MTSTIIPPSPPLSPTFEPHTIPHETISTQTLIDTLHLLPHPEGGYYVELDRDPLLIPSPFTDQPAYTTTTTTTAAGDPALRNASTTILYLLTPHRPQGYFHRNKARTVHTLVQGRGRYVVVHADDAEAKAEAHAEAEADGKKNVKKRIETFVVGRDVEAGERVCWVVEGGKYKASFLLAEEGVDEWESRLLISETVVPGFEFADHDFLREETFDAILEAEQADELRWLVRRGEQGA